jgi:uncharacterized damage-inducible protein DinB
MTSTPTTLTGERADLVQTLDRHRGFFRHTVGGLTDEQATQRTTVSELTLAGLLKHVAHTEQKWADFAERGAPAFDVSNWGVEAWKAEWSLQPGETLPEAPWFEKGASWSVRRTLLHIIAETAQHAGHADILREAIDGQKTMG